MRFHPLWLASFQIDWQPVPCRSRPGRVGEFGAVNAIEIKVDFGRSLKRSFSRSCGCAQSASSSKPYPARPLYPTVHCSGDLMLGHLNVGDAAGLVEDNQGPARMMAVVP